MKQLNIDLGERSYDILIGQGLLDQAGKLIQSAVSAKRAVVVTNPSIHRLFGPRLMDSLEGAGYLTQVILIPEGEDHKSLNQAEIIYDHLMKFHCDRTSILIALGGGVIGDLTGFVAATFMRGVPYVQIPTTLLAQVDSSVGGKTAVNHPKGKNMIGAFYQPRFVIIDLDTLKTLPREEFRSGLAEVVKYGVIADAKLFQYLESYWVQILELNPDRLAHIIETSCSIKARVVEKDERESRHRMILNFGHTLGHAIEALTDYKKFKHGEAVAIGMVFAGKLSQATGRCSEEVVRNITRLIEKLGLPSRSPKFPSETFIETMYHDKKTQDKYIKFILVRDIGSIEIVDQVNETVLKKSLDEFPYQTVGN